VAGVDPVRIGRAQPAAEPTGTRGLWWLAFGAAAASIAMIAASLVLSYVERVLVPAHLVTWDVSDVLDEVVNVATPVVGFVLASRRPRNPIGWMFLGAGLALGVGALANTYAMYALLVNTAWPAGLMAGWLSNWVWVVPLAMLTLLFMLFPTGRLRSRRWRPALWFVAGAFVLITGSLVVVAGQHWDAPYTYYNAQPPPVLAVMYLLMLVALVVGLVAVLTRFVLSKGDERLQLKWFAAASVLVIAAMAALLVNTSPLTSLIQGVAFAGLWTAIALAVLKYRLYDIDRIISRVLAYAIVTGLLIGLYAGLVMLATRVLSFHTPLAVSASTLAAAALFSPLRRRVQHVVDRRFNRAQYDADETVTAFAGRLKDAIELEAVLTDLTGVAHQALAPAHVSVWLRSHPATGARTP
jgi:hypothetical protein